MSIHGGVVSAGRRSALEGDDPDLRRYLVDYRNHTGYSQVLSEYDPEIDNFRRNFVFGTQHTPLAQTGSSSGPQFFQTDHLGTNRGLTGSSGSAVLNSGFEYTPYGSLLDTGADSSLTSQYFTGQYRDLYANLQYHRARWLDTDAGRWLSPDPVFDFPNNFGNPWMYAGGGVVGVTDVDGLLSLMETVTVTGLVSLLTRVSLWGIETVQQAYGIELLAQGSIDSTRSVLNWIDGILLVVSLPSLVRMLPRMISGATSVGSRGLQRLGDAYRALFTRSGDLFRFRVAGLSQPLDAGLALCHPSKYHDPRAVISVTPLIS
ncbi:MAG: hypothetical protein JJU11_18375 [Candidatus Sumerlaeia bacterium]|nr:hypothetical protein [Candidatus Sumerlaeia bacterium]